MQDKNINGKLKDCETTKFGEFEFEPSNSILGFFKMSVRGQIRVLRSELRFGVYGNSYLGFFLIFSVGH